MEPPLMPVRSSVSWRTLHLTVLVRTGGSSTRRELNMNKLEYKVVKLAMKGVFTKDVSPDLENVLNSEGRDGWRLVNTVLPAGGLGESERLVLIFMREAR